MSNAIIYEGPSTFDGKPVVVIATGIDQPSRNSKTGPMVQVYTLLRDTPPIEAVKSGEDQSICGTCIHRGSTCYVNVAQGPTAVYKAYKEGKYLPGNPKKVGYNRSIRLGAYGDMTFDSGVIQDLVSRARMWVGYTHLAATRPDLKGLVQASADTPEEAIAYQGQGWKTYRVRNKGEALLPGEINCPSHKGITCDQCGLCNGRQKNVSIEVHGLKHKIDKYQKWRRTLPLGDDMAAVLINNIH